MSTKTHAPASAAQGLSPRAKGHYWIETGNIKERWEVAWWTGNEWLRIDADDGRDVFPIGPRIPSPDEAARPAPGVDVERLRALVERLRFEREPVPPDSRLRSYREGLRDAAVMIETVLAPADGAVTQGWRSIETAPRAKAPKAADIVHQLQALEGLAARYGLWITRRAINIAVKTYGWELAGDTKMAVACLPPPDQDEYGPAPRRSEP